MAEDKVQASAPVRRWVRQFIGAAIGALVVFAAIWFTPWQPADVGTALMWGAVVGAVLASFDQIAQAGAKLTGREADSTAGRWLNGAVALLAMALLVALVVGLIRWFNGLL